jgi:hypothetical protein
MSDEKTVYVDFRSRDTMTVKFTSARHHPTDPDIVELHYGDAVITDVTRIGIGQYSHEILFDTPGTYRRVWIGRNTDDSFYAESKPKVFIVKKSEV